MGLRTRRRPMASRLHQNAGIMLRVSWVAAAVLALGGLAVAADIYKWVDANGVTHYGSSPPPGVKATRVGPPPALDPAAASQAAARAKQSMADAEHRAAEIASEQARRQAEREAAQAGVAASLRRCAGARQQLDVVTRGGPVFRFDAQGGRAYLADDARDAEIRRLRSEVAAHCAGLDSDAATRERWKEMNFFVACLQAKSRLQTMEQALAQTPGRDLDRARQTVAQLCSPSRFPADTGTRGEWLNQFQ